MLSRYVILTILLVLVAVIVAGCSPSGQPDPADTPSPADLNTTPDALHGADISGAIAHTQVYAFFKALALRAGFGQVP
jgi:amino acid transporter